jgi:hypothetical protein
MLFNFNCESVLNSDKDGFAVIEGSFQSGIKQSYILYANEIVDGMGFASSKV